MHSKYYIPAGSASAPYTVDVTPESAGWTESSLQVVELPTVPEITLSTADNEVMILPRAGAGVVDCDDEAFELSGRASVFDGPADMVYLGTGNTYTLCGEGRGQRRVRVGRRALRGDQRLCGGRADRRRAGGQDRRARGHHQDR